MVQQQILRGKQKRRGSHASDTDPELTWPAHRPCKQRDDEDDFLDRAADVLAEHVD